MLVAALMARTFATSVGDATASLVGDAADVVVAAVDAASVEEEVGGVASLFGTLPSSRVAATAVSSEVLEGEDSLGKGAAEEGGAGATTSPRRFARSPPAPFLLRL